MISIEFARKNDDQKLVDGIREGRKKTLREIYEVYFPIIKNHILRNSGTEDDAKDVFQDAMMAIFQNVSDTEFELTCQFKTYIHAVSSNIWKNKLRKKRNEPGMVSTDVHDIPMEEMQDAVNKIELFELYRRKFTHLSVSCQKLLKLFLSGVDMKQIAKHFSFASVSYAKKRKFQCKQKLIELIESDHDYQLLVS